MVITLPYQVTSLISRQIITIRVSQWIRNFLKSISWEALWKTQTNDLCFSASFNSFVCIAFDSSLGNEQQVKCQLFINLSLYSLLLTEIVITGKLFPLNVGHLNIHCLSKQHDPCLPEFWEEEIFFFFKPENTVVTIFNRKFIAETSISTHVSWMIIRLSLKGTDF